ncbi:MAG TPA: mandelate racemase/muconate lactonizing enzyme family protein [Streptosporangiales bacterium]
MGAVIDRVESVGVEVPLPVPFMGSTYNVAKRATVVTRVYSSDGAVGVVYNGDPRDDAARIASVVSEQLADEVIGKDPENVGEIWDGLFRHTYTQGTRQIQLNAISCLDCAIWDLRARILQTSVAALLGRSPRPVPAIAIAGYYQEGKTLDDLATEMQELKAAGVCGCKMKVGGLSPEEDAERVAAARAGADDGFVLAVDANRAWTVEEALRFASRVEGLGIEWFEEPCRWYADVEGMVRVSARTNIPICAGQSERTSQGARDLMSSGAVDVINYDASEGGGVTEWQRVAALANTYGRRVAHHEEPQISSQLLSSVRDVAYVECFPNRGRDPIWANMVVDGPRLVAGEMVPAGGHGFGLDLSDEFISRFSVEA